MIEGQVDVAAVALGLGGHRVDHLAGGVLHDPLSPRPPGEDAVEREFEPGEAVVVEARVAQHLRGEGALRVEPALLRIEPEPCEVPSL